MVDEPLITNDCPYSFEPEINPLYQEKVLSRPTSINIFAIEILVSIIAGLFILYIITKKR